MLSHFYIDIKLQHRNYVERVYNTREKFSIVSLTSSRMKSIVVFPSRSRFSVKLICSIAFGSASSVCYSLKSVAVILYFSLK